MCKADEKNLKIITVHVDIASTHAKVIRHKTVKYLPNLQLSIRNFCLQWRQMGWNLQFSNIIVLFDV